jgi:hypothetical protein
MGKELDRLGRLLMEAERASQTTLELKKRHWGLITGVIVDIQDPNGKGRVRVAPDNFEGDSATEYWCSVAGSFEGLQPKAMVNQKVLIAPLEGSPYRYKIIALLDGDVGLYDAGTAMGEYNAKFSAADEAALNDRKSLSARSGFMTRLPVYNLRDGDSLPKCHQKNSGVLVVLDDGYDAYQLTCLRYRGGWKWIKYSREVYSNTIDS